MPNVTPLILAFSGGELSPKIDARSNISKYYTGCRTLENFIPLVEGAAVRMPGTYFLVETKASAKVSRLVAFHFSTIQAYVLEVGDRYLRFIKDEGQIVIDAAQMGDFDPSSAYFVGEYVKIGAYVSRVVAGTKTLYVSAPYGRVDSDTIGVEIATAGGDALAVTEAGVTITISLANATGAKNAANLIQVALRALGTCNGVDVSDWYVTENAAYAAARPVAGVVGTQLLDDGEEIYQCDVEIFASATNTNFCPPAEATYWTLRTLGNPVEIVTPYLEADLMDLKFTQSADVLYIFHPSYPPKKVIRTNHIQWELADHVCYTGVEMVITAISQATTAVVTCTNVPITLAAGDIVYIKSVVGMTEVNNLYFTVGTVVTGAAGTFELVGIDSSGYVAWGSGGTAIEAIYGTAGNNPSCGTFFEQRLATGGTNNEPQTLHLSVTADYEDHTLDPTSDDAAIEITLASDRIDRIYWLMGFEFLVGGSTGGVWRIGGTTSSDPISQTNLSAKKQVTVGCKNIEPEMVADALLWVSRSGLSVNQFSYSLEKDKYVPLDTTRISKHITYGNTKALSGIVDMDYQKEPMPILWGIRADGQLLGMTYETQEQVFAWFRIVTDGSFESIAVISQDNEEDQLWVTVNRTGGRYIEFFKPIEFYSQIKDCFFVHSGLTWTGAPAVSVTTISLAAICMVDVAAGHTIATGDKLKFRLTGTWLDTHTVTAHLVAGNTITIWNEGDTAAIDSTAYTAWATITAYAIGDRVAQGGASYQCLEAHTSGVFATDLTAGKWGVIPGFGVYVSGGTVEGVKKAFVAGLTHLNGKTLDILVDGATHPQKTVTAGAITLNYYGNKIHLGLPYTSTVEPMKIHAGSQLGTSRGKKQKIHKLTALFYETRGGKAGPDSDNLKIIPFGTGIEPTLFTGDIDFQFGGDWGPEATITIVQDQPLPMTVLGLVPHLSLNE